jgi:putative endonuclease
MSLQANPQITKNSFAIADFLQMESFKNLNYRQQVGLFGQQVVKYYLLGLNYEVLAENFNTRFGEIDLVVRNALGIRLVEVKTRTNKIHGEPYEAVHYYKLKKMKLSADAFMYSKGWSGEVPYHLDVASVFIDKTAGQVWLKYFFDVEAT